MPRTRIGFSLGEADAGVVARLRDLERQFQGILKIDLVVCGEMDVLDGMGDLPRGERWKLVLYRVIEEALLNVVKHGSTSKARVQVRQEGDEVEVEVRDWGKGFDPHVVREGMGLRLVREYARSVGGECKVEAQEGRGTRVEVRLPVRTATRGGGL